MDEEETPTDFLMSIRYFAKNEKDAWNMDRAIEIAVKNILEDWRKPEVSSAQAFMTRRY